MSGFVKLVTQGARAEDTAGEMAERIKALVYEYSDRMALATAVGVLTIVQREILEEAP